MAQAIGKYFGKLVDMLARTGDALPPLKIYESLFPTQERLVQAISVACVDVIVFCTKVKDVFWRGNAYLVGPAFDSHPESCN